MERITAFSAGRSLFADFQHFLYVKTKTSRDNSKVYLSCRESTCPALANKDRENNVVVTRAHNHEPNEEDYQELLFRQSLRERSSSENTPLKTIFLQEQQQNRLGAQRTEFSEITNLMYRARRAGTPVIPRNIEQFGAIIAEERWLRRYGKDLGAEENIFFQTILPDPLNSVAIFISEGVKRYIENADVCHVHLDGTFKVVPRNGMGTQLFIIHIQAFNTVFPLLYAFMQRKSEDGYIRVLDYLDTIVDMNPSIVMSDYEPAIRNAVRTTWPNATLQGCWFHYARAVFKKSRTLGLQGDDRQKVLVKMAMVLPLLPQDSIEEGMTYLEREGISGPFLIYLRRQWLGQQISVFGADQRTNNSVESFHRELFARVGRPHPNVWALLDILRYVEHGKVCDLTNLVAGRILPRRRRARYIRMNRRLSRCQELLAADHDIPQYMRRVAHMADRLVRLFGPAEALDLYGNIEDAAGGQNIDELLRIVDQALLDIPDEDEGEPEEGEPLGEPDEVLIPHLEPVLAEVPIPEEPPIQGTRCAVCLMNPVTHLLMDCAHAILCTNCATRFGIRHEPDDHTGRCPQCRTQITRHLMRIYL